MTHADAVSRQIIKERFGFCASFLELRDDYLGLVFRNASLNIGRRTLYQILGLGVGVGELGDDAPPPPLHAREQGQERTRRQGAEVAPSHSCSRFLNRMTTTQQRRTFVVFSSRPFRELGAHLA